MLASLENVLAVYKRYDEGPKDPISQLRESVVAYVPDAVMPWSSKRFSRTSDGRVAFDATISRAEAFAYSPVAVSLRRLARWIAY